MKVVFSKRADRDVDRIDAWWRDNRPAAPDLFVHEITDAVSRLENPGAILGIEKRSRRGTVLFRLLLERTEQHVYFRRDNPSLITVLCVWGARRRRAPKL
jgi:plasmid stabilization system protein ParE